MALGYSFGVLRLVRCKACRKTLKTPASRPSRRGSFSVTATRSLRVSALVEPAQAPIPASTTLSSRFRHRRPTFLTSISAWVIRCLPGRFIGSTRLSVI